MHKLNLLEVYYDFYRDDGKEQAETVLGDTLLLPRIVMSLASLNIKKQSYLTGYAEKGTWHRNIRKILPQFQYFHFRRLFS